MTNRTAARGAQARPPKFNQDNFNRFAWRDAVFADRTIPAKAKLAAHGIANHVDSESGEAYPSYDTIARLAGLPVRTARRMIAVLCDLGWLEVIQPGSRGRGEKHATRYRIILKKTAIQSGSFIEAGNGSIEADKTAIFGS